MILRAPLAVGFICLALMGCSDDEPASALVAGTPYSDVSTQVAAAEWKAVIDDWYVDGTFDEPHRCVAIREAVKQLPSSTPEHSTVYADMRRIERRACG